MRSDSIEAMLHSNEVHSTDHHDELRSSGKTKVKLIDNNL